MTSTRPTLPLATLVAAAATAFLSAACASGPALRVEPINQYRAYGEYHTQAEDDAVVAKAASADPTGKTIHVFQEALPPGIEMNGRTFGIAAGGNAAIIVFDLVPNDHQDLAQGIEAILANVDESVLTK